MCSEANRYQKLSYYWTVDYTDAMKYLINRLFFGVFLIGGLSRCIGTDVVDDLATETFSVAITRPATTSFEVGETVQLSARKLTSQEIEVPRTQFIWSSSAPEVATVDDQGLVTTLAPGQTEITVAEGQLSSNPLQITVVSDASQVVRVTITTETGNLQINETLQLTHRAENLEGNEIASEAITWSSSRPEVISVNETGLVTALADGTSEITATVDGVASEPYLLTVGEPVAAERSGTLQGKSGYTASGTVTLSKNEEGEVILTTSDDFKVSLALGTFLYLSNSEAGATTATSGLEVADVSKTPEGQQSFNVTQVDANIDLDTYNYVVVLCKPARLTFGSAELK